MKEVAHDQGENDNSAEDDSGSDGKEQSDAADGFAEEVPVGRPEGAGNESADGHLKCAVEKRGVGGNLEDQHPRGVFGMSEGAHEHGRHEQDDEPGGSQPEEVGDGVPGKPGHARRA